MIYLQKLNYEATSIFDLFPNRIYTGLVSLLCKLSTRTLYWYDAYDTTIKYAKLKPKNS